MIIFVIIIIIIILIIIIIIIILAKRYSSHTWEIIILTADKYVEIVLMDHWKETKEKTHTGM
jgi:ABC-type proline/glycine betaine transport system permease subunit